jgi:GT2 family glycosyltransferase/MoaA/NifB/PqqE/SkfB family radical SAM enzyme
MPIGTPNLQEPSVSASVITVNFNGRRLLGELLPSLLEQSLEPSEIIVVDNGSSDGSAEFVRDSFPEVRLLPSRRNLGYAAANNLGIRESRGQYVALINNDAIADEHWLRELVAEAERDADVGAVASKVVFLRPYLPVHLSIEPFCPANLGASSDSSQLGVLVDTASGFEGSSYRKPIFKLGFRAPEWIGGRPMRWSGGEATVLLPVERRAADTSLRLRISGGAFVPPRLLSLTVGTTLRRRLRVGPDFEEVCIPVAQDVVERECYDVINNAGSVLDVRGEVHDRGIYEPDWGQYDEAEDVSALCAAGMLMRRSVLQHVGLFDERLFMYYEDTDLSLRIRARGYRLRYQPRSVLHHHHSATNDRESTFIAFLIERNRLLMLARNGERKQFLQALGREVRKAADCLLATLRGLPRPSPAVLQRALFTWRVHKSLVKQLPRALYRRLRSRMPAPPANAPADSGGRSAASVPGPPERRYRNWLECQRSLSQGLTQVPHSPLEIQLEVTTDCNLRCTMCPPITWMRLAPSHMPQQLLRRLGALLPTAVRLVPFGGGEPLVYPHLMEVVEIAKRQGVNVSFNTNGMLLTQELSHRLIDLEVDLVGVSVDAGTKVAFEGIRRGASFQRIIANLEFLAAEKRRQQRAAPQVAVSCVLMKDNLPDIPELIRVCRSVGVTTLCIEQLDPPAPSWDNGYHQFFEQQSLPGRATGELASALEACDRAAEREGVSVFPADAFSRRYRPVAAPEPQREEDSTGDAGRAPQTSAPLCTMPWTSLYVSPTGLVQTCCLGPRTLGNLAERDLHEVWNGPEFQDLRARLLNGDLLPTCASCIEARKNRPDVPEPLRPRPRTTSP